MSDDAQCRKADIVDAVLAVHHGGNGHGRVDALKQAVADMSYRNCDSIVGRALTGDDHSARLSHVILDSLVIKLRHRKHILTRNCISVAVNRDVGDISDGPRNEGRIAVLTEYVCVNVLLVYIVVLGDARTQTSCVEDCTRTDDAVLGDVRALHKYICKNIDRIADDYVNSLIGILCYLGDNALCNVYVRLCEVETRLTGLTCHAACKNNNVGACRIAVGARVNRNRGLAEGDSLTDVKRLSQRLFLVDIDHYDFRGYTRNRKGISDCRTDTSGSDNCDLVHR